MGNVLSILGLEFDIKNIHFGALSTKIASLLLFCCDSTVVGKLGIKENLANSFSSTPPLTQNINKERDKIIKIINAYLNFLYS